MSAVNPPVHGAAAPTPDRYQRLMRPLVGGLVVALLALTFLYLASEVIAGNTRALDLYALQFAQSLRAEHPWVARAMLEVSSLGSTVVVTLITVATVGYLLIAYARVTALLVALSIGSGALVLTGLKNAFARARPASEFAEVVASGLSFPSGHASMAALVFLTLGALVAGTRVHTRERLYVLVVAAVGVGLVGLSRVALGVHWLTDVLAGWALGTAWAIVWLVVAHHLAQRGSRLDREAS